MNKWLLIMRHAKAERDASRWEDFERPLAHRGEKDAPTMGRWLQQQQIIPDKVIASPAVRSRDTARLVAKEIEFSGEIALPPTLYDGSTDAYVAQIRLCPISTKILLVVGHNPALELLVESLTGEFTSLPTSAIAQLETSESDWAKMSSESCELIEVWTPKTVSL